MLKFIACIASVPIIRRVFYVICCDIISIEYALSNDSEEYY